LFIKSTPSIETIGSICKIFHVSPNELLNFKEEKLITNKEYSADKIVQSSIFSFFINLVLYILGTVCIYTFEVVIPIYPINWIIGGVLWALAILYTIYTTSSNISSFKKTNGEYKHIVYILTLILLSIIMFPLLSISIYQSIHDMIMLLIPGRFNFASWIHMYGRFLFIFLISIILYIVALVVSKKKYSRK